MHLCSSHMHTHTHTHVRMHTHLHAPTRTHKHTPTACPQTHTCTCLIDLVSTALQHDATPPSSDFPPLSPSPAAPLQLQHLLDTKLKRQGWRRKNKNLYWRGRRIQSRTPQMLPMDPAGACVCVSVCVCERERVCVCVCVRVCVGRLPSMVL